MSEKKTAPKPRAKKAAEPAEEKTAKFLAVTKTPLNFRKGPSYEHEIIRILAQGEKLALSGSKENGFAEATNAEGVSGWGCMENVEVRGLD